MEYQTRASLWHILFPLSVGSICEYDGILLLWLGDVVSQIWRDSADKTRIPKKGVWPG